MKKNQILEIPIIYKSEPKKRFVFKLQFSISILFLICFIVYGIYFFIYIHEKSLLSSNILSNYEISRLYSNIYEEESDIWGIIEIPKINIYYPVFSKMNDELLRISPCKFYRNYFIR